MNAPSTNTPPLVARLVVGATLTLTLGSGTPPAPATAAHPVERTTTRPAPKLPTTGHATKTIHKYVKKGGNIQAAVDQCRGPVAARLGHPNTARWLLPQHDYCGGKWILKVKKGQLVTIRNGKLAGTYRATGKTKTVKRGASASQTKGLGFLVLQTCIPGSTNMKLVGLRKPN